MNASSDRHFHPILSAKRSAEDTEQKPAKKAKQAQRKFDFSRFRSRRIALCFAYLGFVVPEGLVQQADGDSTVEELLLSGACRTCLIEEKKPFGDLRTSVGYSLCGRTDKGVSGLGNVVTLIVRSNAKVGEELPEFDQELKYGHVLNRVLPPGVRVLSWALVDDDFNARFDCQYRSYKYFFVGGNLDIAAMQKAASYLVGPHDFRNFCTMDVANVTHFDREILEASIQPVEGFTSADARFQLFEFNIRGTAFLYHQIRCTMSILFMVGQHHEDPLIVKTLFDVKSLPRKPQYHIASGLPLVLHNVGYCSERVKWQYDIDTRNKAIKHFMELWVGQFSLQAAVTHCIIKQLQHDTSDEADLAVAHGESEHQSKHIKLLSRKTEETYEERRASMEKRVQRREERKQEEGTDN